MGHYLLAASWQQPQHGAERETMLMELWNSVAKRRIDRFFDRQRDMQRCRQTARRE
jgi:hypothetical protein